MSKEDRIYIPIITNLGITSKKVKKKSVDFMAILDYKAPTLGKNDSCKYYACVDAACRGAFETFPRALALKKAGISDERYQEAFGEVCGVLNKIFGHSMEETGQNLKLPQCTATATAIRAHFEKQYLSRLPESKRADAKFNEQQVVTASFSLACEAHHEPFNTMALLSPTSVSPSQWRTMRNQIRELLPEGLLPSQGSGHAQGQIQGNGHGNGGSGHGGSAARSGLGSSAPPKKKQKGPSGAAIPAPDDLELDFEAPPPRIRRDMPIDASMAELLKIEDEQLAATIKKASMLTTSSTTMEVPSKSEKLAQEDDTYQQWRQKVLEKAQEQRSQQKAKEGSSKQSTINFAKASSSNAKD